ncbi:MAG: sulfotransferase domain-containing protein [Planctomycetes bacterium]|nr:sulfotransferase domain-containing protein [Planctomycetota bacterium]
MTIKEHMIRASHYATWFLGSRFPKAIPLVFVVAYPRSGTTWVAHLVADYLQLPFPILSLLPVGFPAVVKGHDRVWKSYPRGIYVLRDGRDALVSIYWRVSPRQRRAPSRFAKEANTGDSIAAFVERQLTARKPFSSPVNWDKHVRSYFEVKNPNVVLVRYEDLLRDGETTLAKAMAELTGEEADLGRVRDAINKFSFERQTGRPAGVEDRSAWYRKGQAGDWVNLFTREAAEIFDRYCGDTLIAAGYEADHSWVESFRDQSREPAQTTVPLGTGGNTGAARFSHPQGPVDGK